MTTILAIGLILGLLFFGVAHLRETKYSATATLLLKSPTSAEALFGSGAPVSAQTVEREFATSEELAGLGWVAARSAERLKGLSAEAVAAMVTVSKGAEVDLISIESTAHDPAQAKTLANVYARQYITFRVELARAKLSEARTLVERKLNGLSKAERKSEEGKQLHTTAAKLAALGTLQTGGAALIKPATLPDSPSSPKPLRDGLVGLLLGLLLGLGAMLFLDRLRGRLLAAADVADALGLPLLAVVSESHASGEPAPFDSMVGSLAGPSGERGRAVLITAIREDECVGAATWALARAAVGSARVLLVEANFRQLSSAGYQQLSTSPGLAELMAGEGSIDSVVQTVSGRAEELESVAFDVIVLGSGDPPQTLGGERMRELLDRLRALYDLVLIDAPSIGSAPDAFPLVGETDGVIVASRLGWSSAVDAKAIRAELDRLGASTLGVVVLEGGKSRTGRRLGGVRLPGPLTSAGRERL